MEDIVWNLGNDDGDYRMSYQVDGLVNQSERQSVFHKKARHGVRGFNEKKKENIESTQRNAVRKGDEVSFSSSLMDEKHQILEYSCSDEANNMFPVSFNDECMNQVWTTASNNSEISSNCLDAYNLFVSANNFAADCDIFGNAYVIDESNLCSFSCGISPDYRNIDFVKDELNSREKSDLLNSGWFKSPDASQFEEFGEIFRNNDSANEQGNAGYVDDFFWLSSSPCTKGDNSKDNLKAAFHSSSAELSASGKFSAHEVSMPIWFESEQTTSDENACTASFVYRSFAHCLDADSTERLPSIKGEVNAKGQILKDSHHAKEMMYGSQSYYSCSPDSAARYNDEKCLSSAAPTSEALLCWPDGIQNCSFESTSSNHLLSHNPHVELKNSHCHRQTHIIQSTMIIESVKNDRQLLSCEASGEVLNHRSLSEEKMLDPVPMPSTLTARQTIELSHYKQQLHPRLTVGHPDIRQFVPTICKDEVSAEKKHILKKKNGGDHQVQETRSEHSGQDSLSSQSISLGPINFCQLQEFMNQLDIRIKLCLRDGLYRLAKSAEKRHHVDNRRPGCGNVMTASTTSLLEAVSNKCIELKDVEIGTNSIDRSIMELLFNCKSEYISACEDAMSLESYITRTKLSPPGDTLESACQELYPTDRKLMC